jgi:hypothetical protein
MTISLTPSQSDTTTALRSFLIGYVLPPNVDVILAQVNRVAEPSNPDFVMMTPIRRRRLETNYDVFVDAKFTASIATVTSGLPPVTVTTMTVTAFAYGALKVGSVVFGVNVANGTQVTAFGSGSGGLGTYLLNTAQTVASETMAAGVFNSLQPTEVAVQLDVHGPNSADNCQRISTLFRDDYAVRAFNSLNPNVAPLHADDFKQMPFINDQNQWEWRWVAEACLQVNATVADVPQQFFDQIVTTFIPADIIEPV